MHGSFDYRLRIFGEETADLKYDTSAANMAAAVNALKACRQRGPVTVTFNQAISAGATVTCTFNGEYLYEGPESMIKLIPSTLFSCSGASDAITTRTTLTNRGWSTGSKEVKVIAFVFKRLTSLNGNIQVDYL
jgi:hypothetical protein